MCVENFRSISPCSLFIYKLKCGRMLNRCFWVFPATRNHPMEFPTLSLLYSLPLSLSRWKFFFLNCTNNPQLHRAWVKKERQKKNVVPFYVRCLYRAPESFKMPILVSEWVCSATVSLYCRLSRRLHKRPNRNTNCTTKYNIATECFSSDFRNSF